MELKNRVKAALAMAIATGALAAGCGSSDSSTPSGAGGSGGSSGGMTVNGCDPATAEDHTGDASVTIQFSGHQYSPPCIRIKAGSSVTWMGSFDNHPLNPGKVSAGTPHQDTTGPIQPTSMGSSQTVMFPAAGTYPFYCGIHFSLGMMGAVFVE